MDSDDEGRTNRLDENEEQLRTILEQLRHQKVFKSPATNVSFPRACNARRKRSSVAPNKMALAVDHERGESGVAAEENYDEELRRASLAVELISSVILIVLFTVLSGRAANKKIDLTLLLALICAMLQGGNALELPWRNGTGSR